MSEPRSGLPPHATLAFAGKIFEVWQWQQEMFDGSTETFERIWRPPTVEILATVGDQLIIEDQDQPDRKNNINLPSGRADQTDDPLIEAKRELLEETGYVSDDWQLWWEHQAGGKVLHDVYYFIARNCRKEKEPHLDPGERITTRLVSFEDLLVLADDPRFWAAPQLVNRFLRMQQDPTLREAFRSQLFGKP